MTVGLPPHPLSSPVLSLTQSAEATTTSTSSTTSTTAVPPKCFGRAPTIVGTNNDDVTQGTEGNDVIVGLNGD
jgi:hypothetical protein